MRIRGEDQEEKGELGLMYSIDRSRSRCPTLCHRGLSLGRPDLLGTISKSVVEGVGIGEALRPRCMEMMV